MRILATIKKELILILRDRGGLATLFIMPITLIIVMALIQDAPFRDYLQLKFDIVYVNSDHSKLGNEIRKGLAESGHFKIIDSINKKEITEEEVEKLIHAGTYKIGVIIPSGATGQITNSANKVTNVLVEKMGLPIRLPESANNDSLSIKLMFDPVAKKSFKISVSNALDKYITKIESDVLLKQLSTNLKNPSDTISKDLDLSRTLNSIAIQEINTGTLKEQELTTNSVQHNVPAWSIFGMFFIVTTIAGSMIREREEGSHVRIKLIPGPYSDILIGKLSFYILFTMVQFFVMLMVGFFLLPYFGLSKLELGQSISALLFTVFCISASATSFGIFVGSVFKTSNQALPFGTISVVILSAIGGIWIPVEILPSSMQLLAKISPLHWSLDAINEVFLRNGGISSVVVNNIILLSISAVLIFIAWFAEKRRSN